MYVYAHQNNKRRKVISLAKFIQNVFDFDKSTGCCDDNWLQTKWQNVGARESNDEITH